MKGARAMELFNAALSLFDEAIPFLVVGLWTCVLLMLAHHVGLLRWP